MSKLPPELEQIVEQAANAALSFRGYVSFVHDWEVRRHQEGLFDALQSLTDGTLKDMDGKPTHKLMALQPPGSGKTDTLVEYNSFMIGRACQVGMVPQVGFVCYADDVATLRSMAVRDTIDLKEKYKLVFPEAIPLRDKRWASHEWFLRRPDPSQKDPTFRAAGITGQILSFRFPTLITIDDPHDRKSVSTTHQKDEVWRVWRDTIFTRGDENTPIVLICTRWAEDDLAGRLMEVEKDWHIVHVSALQTDEDGESYSYWPPEKVKGRMMGISLERLEWIKEHDPQGFQTQYQALPPSAEGDTFKWWRLGVQPPLTDVSRVYQCWDTSYTTKTRSTYNVMVEFLKTKQGWVFINHVFRKKLDFPALMDAVVEEYKRGYEEFGDKVIVLIENKASGGPVTQMIQRNTGVPVRAIDIKRLDLVTRSAAISKYFETGRIVLPEQFKGWKDTYQSELKAFPQGQYNDQVAATVLGLEYIFPSHAIGRPIPTNYIWVN